MMITRGYEAQQLEEDRPAQINVTSRGSSRPSWSEPPTWANPLFQLSLNFELVFLKLLDGEVNADDTVFIMVLLKTVRFQGSRRLLVFIITWRQPIAKPFQTEAANQSFLLNVATSHQKIDKE